MEKKKENESIGWAVFDIVSDPFLADTILAGVEVVGYTMSVASDATCAVVELLDAF